MNKEQLLDAQSWAEDELHRSVDFWLTHGMDKEHGGVFTCLDRKGNIYSTDKSVWMQGRCGWLFSYLCHMYGVREEWLSAARSCLDFMEDHCVNRAAGDRLYFSVTEDGKPLRQRRHYYSEAIYAGANAEYYGITGDEDCLERARRAYNIYWELSHGGKDPAGLEPKTIPETRSGRYFGLPMTILNVISILMRVDPENKEEYESRAQQCVDEILQYHVHPELGCVLEHVDVDGTPRLYYGEGRMVNPGHDVECAWYLLEHAQRTGNKELVKTAAQIFDWAAEAGWDKKYGGLLYLIDCQGKPPEVFEHDMKLWWSHSEFLVSSLMLVRDTKDDKYLDWFYRAMNYCQSHFSDPEYGEWYGCLRRDGLPTEPSAKGSTFKGPFHMPRSMILVDNLIDQILGDI
jgi:N-acylglucosamine 2-epimerase